MEKWNQEMPDQASAPLTALRHYTNPVYPHYFADPCVWKYQNVYYAIGTGPSEASGHVEDAKQISSGLLSHLRLFPLLRSEDFVTWHSVGGALIPPNPDLGDTFWAPEVACREGEFFLYYSVGREDKGHQLRVAHATHPLGPYTDQGHALLDPAMCSFAIDAHPFQDDDDQWYLFYATDFLDTAEDARPGTALVVDRLIDMKHLAGEPQVVLRARADWQRFQRDRAMYDGIYDWHTLEGPFVRKVGGRYYCLYSGGRWDSADYGVDFAVADQVMGPYSDAGMEAGARVLQGVPGHSLGPGHCSVVRGPDEVTDYLAYHAWDPDMSARRMCLDPLLWSLDGPHCHGPTWTPQAVTAVLSWQSQL